MKWTSEQNKAITKDNCSIIVSAGAGSGKTAVLTERVIRKIKDGININELLILTFTNKAANEMRERIRKSLKEYPEFKKQLDLINEAYITTFDSFALSTIKKYHYILNIPKNITIADSSLIFIEKQRIIGNIFENLYKENNPLFIKLINDFCVKDDENIKKYILDIYDASNLLIDKKNYFDNYLKNFFNDKKIESDIKEFENLIKNKLDDIIFNLDNIKEYDYEYYEKISASLTNLLESNNYDDIKNNIDLKLPPLPKNCDEDLKIEKENISDNLDQIKKMCEYNNSLEIKETINLTHDYVNIIIDILENLDNELIQYKKENNIYEFHDISLMLINLLKNNPDICEDFKNTYNEIMIDEYQDTNDIQEAFISLISNNNVYMVGDIKQSIYRFRNANPNIFKNKYGDYSKNNGGIKIDLNNNFRSRSQVLDNINLIFSNLMSSNIGGADYNNGHAMIYGNKSYDENKSNENYNMDILNYQYDKNIGYTKEEIEVFITANDILNKIKNKYQVFDKDTKKLRDCNFNDFVILIDRATNFDLFKKIFEYHHIPLTIYKDEKLNNEIEISVLKNIVSLCLKIKNQEFDNYFKYLFTSIGRSFLFDYNDNDIFKFFVDDNFLENDIYQKCFKLSEIIDYSTNEMFLQKIIDEFNVTENLIKLGDIQNRIVRLDYLTDLATTLDNLGYTIKDFNDYLNNLIEADYDIRFSLSKETPNSVKIMTIHASKGLEFNICYFPLLYKDFNLSDLNERFAFDNKYGIVSPYFKEGIGKTIYKYLLKNKYIEDEISEKIRLFYVALTRAKEHIVLITSIVTDLDTNITDNNKMKFRSFLDMLQLINMCLKPYITNIDLTDISLTHDYNLTKKITDLSKFSDNKKIQNKKINVENKLEEDKVFSKHEKHYISFEEQKNLDIGTYFHYLLEIIDFKINDLDKYDIDDFYKNKINNFLRLPLLKNIDKATIYKEYEFLEIDDNIKKHGIIDLMLEYEDYIDIIDYKFRNIDDINYINQLKGYKNYIEKKTNKKVNIYLYSIMEEKIKNVE